MLHLLEIASVSFLFVYMYFAYKRNAIAWLFGILGSVLSSILFFQNGFYGSVFLNIIYAFQGFIGYFEWKWKAPNQKPSNNLTPSNHLFLIGLSLLFAFGLKQLLFFYKIKEFNFFDLCLACLSITATYLEIKKELSCWWYWIVCNIAYSILYLNLNKNEPALMYYSFLMIVLAVFSWFALKEWSKNLQIKE